MSDEKRAQGIWDWISDTPNESGTEKRILINNKSKLENFGRQWTDPSKYRKSNWQKHSGIQRRKPHQSEQLTKLIFFLKEKLGNKLPLFRKWESNSYVETDEEVKKFLLCHFKKTEQQWTSSNWVSTCRANAPFDMSFWIYRVYRKKTSHWKSPFYVLKC